MSDEVKPDELSSLRDQVARLLAAALQSDIDHATERALEEEDRKRDER